MKSFKYYVVDVFTSERYRGNQLSVVLTDSDLELSAYEKISSEFGYSETSFIYYSEKDKALKIRSFTPTGFEVNGAGHNLLGAVCLALLINLDIFHAQGDERFVIMKDEVIKLSVHHTKNQLPFVGMRQNPATLLTHVDPKILAKALNLKENDILTDDLAPAVVKTEVTHLMVPLANADALNSAVPEKHLLIQTAEKYDFEGVYCFTIADKDSGYLAHARFFNPGIGIDEDPATGSAAGPLAGFLFQKNRIDLNTVYQILQGEKMGRPSVIQFEVKNDSISISGSSVIVMEGVLFV